MADAILIAEYGRKTKCLKEKAALQKQEVRVVKYALDGNWGNGQARLEIDVGSQPLYAILHLPRSEVLAKEMGSLKDIISDAMRVIEEEQNGNADSS